MQTSNCTIAYLCDMLREWHMVAKDVVGRFEGLPALWDPRWVSMKAYSFFGGISLTSFFQGFSHRIHLINIYAPYLDRLTFWKKMEDCGIIFLQNFIIASDFNCTLSKDEIWGEKGREDPLSEVLKEMFINAGLCDLPLEVNYLTWFNRRKGNEIIGKRFDRVVMDKCLRTKMGNITVKEEDITISNHMPISMIWEFEKCRGGHPFKFNRVWLEDKDFNELIKGYMKNHKRVSGTTMMYYLSNTLRELKKVVQSWEKKHK